MDQIGRFATGAISLLQYGKFKKAELYFNLANDFVSKIIHTNTMSTALFSLTTLNIYLGNYKAAENYVNRLNSIPVFFLKPAIPYLYSLVKLLSHQNFQELLTSDQMLSFAYSNLLNILNNDNKESTSRAMYQNVMEIAAGRSLESLQAELCLVKLINWSEDDDNLFNNYLDAGLKYIESFLLLPHSKGFEVVLPLTNCLFLKVQLMMLDKRFSLEKRKEDSLIILRDLITMSEKTNVFFVKILTGYYLIKLNIDVNLGREVLDQFINSSEISSTETIRELDNIPICKCIIDAYHNNNKDIK